MNEKVKYSILIPVYNSEKFIINCLDSIVKQSITNYEVIIVDDGSTDNSRKICEEYTKKHSNFFLISQENQGTLVARISALKEVDGEYVLFLDSDDFWEPDTLFTIDNNITKFNKPDILVFNHNRVNFFGDFLSKHKKNLPYNIDIKMSDYPKTIFKSLVSSGDLNSLWSKAIKSKLFDLNMNFYKQANISLAEDLLISAQVILNSQNIVCIDNYLYNYRVNPTSITRNFNKNNFYDTIKVYDLILVEMQKDIRFTKELLYLSNEYRAEIIFSQINRVINSKWKYKERRDFLFVMFENTSLRLVFNHFSNNSFSKNNIRNKLLSSLLMNKLIFPVFCIVKIRLSILKVLRIK